MKPHAFSRSRRNPVATSRCPQSGTASVLSATERDRQILRAARERCERRVRLGRQSMIIGLFLGSAAIVAHYCVNEPSFRWPLLIAAALELGFVPFYTTLACRRLRYIVALIDRELEQGQVEHGVGRAPQFGVWPVLEDTDTPRISFALAAISRFPSLPSGFPVAPPAQAARAAESGCVLPSC